MTNFNYSVGSGIGPLVHQFWPFLSLLFIWSIFWKGLALWHSAKRSNTIWFIVFLFLNTVGIAEIVYLFGVIKLKFSELFIK